MRTRFQGLAGIVIYQDETRSEANVIKSAWERPRVGALHRRSGGKHMRRLLPFWQRLLLTIVAMFAASWIVGLLWHSIFSFQLPSYVAGMIGGLAALPCWEFLKRIRPSKGA